MCTLARTSLDVCHARVYTRPYQPRRMSRACVHSPVPENGNEKIKTKREYVRNGHFFFWNHFRLSLCAIHKLCMRTRGRSSSSVNCLTVTCSSKCFQVACPLPLTHSRFSRVGSGTPDDELRHRVRMRSLWIAQRLSRKWFQKNPAWNGPFRFVRSPPFFFLNGRP